MTNNRAQQPYWTDGRTKLCQMSSTIQVVEDIHWCIKQVFTFTKCMQASTLIHLDKLSLISSANQRLATGLCEAGNCRVDFICLVNNKV